MDNRAEPIITKETFNVSKETIWKAITDLSEMTQWFFDNIPNFKPEVGFETEFLVSSTERDFTHIWKVTEVIPNQKIAYTWNYKEYEGESKSIFEITENGNEATLTITCVGLENLPNDIPEFTRESCQGGWNYFMNRFKEYINKV